VEAAHEFLECFVAAQAGFERPRQYLTEQAQVLIDQGPVVLFHDELGVVYQPVYFHEFLAHANRHGLQYLTEANYYNTQSGKIPAGMVAEVERLTGGNRILREQYFDFLKLRMFRQTLLCHAGIELPAGPLTDRVCRLAASSPAKPVSAQPDLGPTVEEEFRGYRGAAVRTAHPLAKAIMLTLSEVWPEALRFHDLQAAAGRLTGQQPNPETVAGILISTLGAGLTELHARPPRVVSKPSRFPTASALARLQAEHGAMLTTGLHTMVRAEGEIERRLIALLDGTRDLSALARELAPVLNRPEDVAEGQIEANLAKLAKMGLLEA
jgi:methyltransferase-like protein